MKLSHLLLCTLLAFANQPVFSFAADGKVATPTLTPENSQAKAQSKALLSQQFSENASRAKTIEGGRLWFAAFGLDSQSKAFHGDVDLALRRITQLNPASLNYLMDNQAQTKELARPFAHLGNMNETLKHIGQHKRDGDIVTIFVSAHGNVSLLATQIGERRYANINDGQLATILKPLKELPTIIIISACHSGSLIPSLARANRIILTAAAKEKTSYGCQPLSDNTFFVDELFGNDFDVKSSLRINFEQAVKRIAKREEVENLTPSEPQISIGEKMKEFAEKPLVEWLSFSAASPLPASVKAATPPAK